MLHGPRGERAVRGKDLMPIYRRLKMYPINWNFFVNKSSSKSRIKKHNGRTTTQAVMLNFSGVKDMGFSKLDALDAFSGRKGRGAWRDAVPELAHQGLHHRRALRDQKEQVLW